MSEGSGQQMDGPVTFHGEVAADRAGSSCHIHFSLWRDGKNAFGGNTDLGPVKCSESFRWFLGAGSRTCPR